MTPFDVPAARALCAVVSRTLLPAALDEIERLRAALAVERKACDEWRSFWGCDGTSATLDIHARLDAACRAHDARRAGENK